MAVTREWFLSAKKGPELCGEPGSGASCDFKRFFFPSRCRLGVKGKKRGRGDGEV